MIREVVSNELLTILLIVSIILVAFCKGLFYGRFNDLVALIGNSKYSKIYGRDQKFFDLFDGILFTNLLFSTTLFAIIIIYHLSPETNIKLPVAFKIFVVLAFILLIKVLVERLVGSVFEIDELIDDYIFQKISYKNLIGLLLIPINALLIYTLEPSKIIFYVIISFLFLINFIGFIISFRNHQKLILNNLFYFILYLCALEISPYIILYKLII